MSPDPAAGMEVAGYRIVEQAGSGGMGVVYRAEEIGLGGRPVALKLLPAALAGDLDFRARFLREMRVAAAIDHPNIVPIYRAGEDRGRLYLAMRYVHASDLRRVLEAEGRLAPARALAILDQVARALDAAHARGLVHRDVKPGNILLAPPVFDGDAEHVYLVDFGLARSDSDDRSLGGAGSFLGTPRYAAPEQAAGRPVDGRTDGYALGCVLYECLTGQPPSPGGSGEAVLLAHLEAPHPGSPPSALTPPRHRPGRVLRHGQGPRHPGSPPAAPLLTAAHQALTPTPTSVPLPAAPPAPIPTGWPGPPAPAATLEGYLPLRRPARRVRLALGVSILLALASAAANAGDTQAARSWPAAAPATCTCGSAGPGGLVPGHGRAVAGLVPARLPEPARPRGQAAALPALVGGWRLAGPGVQPVPPQAGPQRHLAGQRPRLPPDQADTWRGARWPSCSAGGGWPSWPRSWCAASPPRPSTPPPT